MQEHHERAAAHVASVSKVVLQVSVESLTRCHTLSISPLATAERFRLIDCDQFLHHHVLTVHEFPYFPVPEILYAAISYIWRGNSTDGHTVGATLRVPGTEDGDPIALDVLRHACTAALRHKVNYLWLDRLCIIQTCSDDKIWQIRRMFKIYEGCAVCLVFPGGIQRLVHIDEPTLWIHRAWTLQEALAPPKVEVVYSWTYGTGMYLGRYRGYITELLPRESAITPLRELLGLNTLAETTFYPLGGGSISKFCTTIFGLRTDPSSGDRSERTTELVIFMLRNALPHGEDSFEERAPMVWRSVLFRTSSRPVDMVFSIMGLFKVTLDPRDFDPNDRLGATIALMRKILDQPGGQASWLSVAPYLPPHQQLSTFPVFPRTSVDGRVEFEFDLSIGKNGSLGKTVGKRLLAVSGKIMLTGSMDEAGYLCISRQAIRVYPLPGTKPEEDHNEHLNGYRSSPPRCCLDIWANNGTGWQCYNATTSKLDASQGGVFEPKTFVVWIGWLSQFSWTGQWEGPRFLSAMLVREHAPGHYHVESYFELNEILERWVKSWKIGLCCVGGPSVQ